MAAGIFLSESVRVGRTLGAGVLLAGAMWLLGVRIGAIPGAALIVASVIVFAVGVGVAAALGVESLVDRRHRRRAISILRPGEAMPSFSLRRCSLCDRPQLHLESVWMCPTCDVTRVS